MLYHGSETEGLTQLIPHIAERKKEMVYLTDNMVIAVLYTVNAAGRPYYYFPYGFDNGLPVYTEYYPDSLADIYRGKRGYVYRCKKNRDLFRDSQLSGVWLSEKPVPVESCTEMCDVYEQLLAFESEGRLKVRRFETLKNGERDYIIQVLRGEIQRFHLHDNPGHPYSRFLARKFPEAWEE